jgi:hypothetical protein
LTKERFTRKQRRSIQNLYGTIAVNEKKSTLEVGNRVRITRKNSKKEILRTGREKFDNQNS